MLLAVDVDLIELPTTALQFLVIIIGLAVVSGVGLVLVLGMGLILLGIGLMLAWRAVSPDFFRGQTLHRDTPTVVID